MKPDCNEMRLMANEIMRQIYIGEFPDDEKIGQLDLLRSYAEVAIEHIKAEKPKDHPKDGDL